MSKSGEFKTAISPEDNGILTINDVSPDAFGNFEITSADGSIDITDIVNGINIEVSDGTPQNLIFANAQTGSDVTGNGSPLKPYATLTFTMASITTNSATNPFCIFATGIFAETPALKPWVSVSGTSIGSTSIVSFTLASNWNNLVGAYASLSNITFSGSLSLSVTGTIGTAARLTINNCTMQNIGFSSSRPTIGDTIIFRNSQTGIFQIQDNFGEIYSSSLSSITNANSVSATTARTLRVVGSIITGNVTAASTSGQAMTVTFSSTRIGGNATATGSGAIIYDADSIPSGTLSGTTTASPRLNIAVGGLNATTTPASGSVLVGNGTQWVAAASLPPSIVGGVTHFVYVDSTLGSNVTGTGSAIAPYQTLTFAMASIAGNSATSLFCLFAVGVFNENVAVKPFTTILGTGTKTTLINGTLSLAASWNTVAGSFSLINLYVEEIDFDSSGFASGTVSLFASGILQGATSADNFSLNAGTNTGFVEIRNSSLSGNWILRDYTLTGLYVDFFVFDYDRPNGSGGIFSFLYNSVCAAGSPVPSISSSGGATLFFVLRNTQFDGLEVNADVQLTYDVNSYPNNGFTFAGNGTALQTICSPGIIAHTLVNTGTYTVLPSDYYLACAAAAPIALTFPTATGSGRTIVIKNAGGDAATFPITILSAGATFDGISPLVVNTNYGSVTCTDIFNNNWSLT